MEVHFVRGSGLGLRVFTDANCASKPLDRQSVYGVDAMVGETAIAATSSTRRYTTPSIGEVEYMATWGGAKLGFHIRAVISFLQPSLTNLTILMYGQLGS